jgi:PAS domain S-box-containing protein
MFSESRARMDMRRRTVRAAPAREGADLMPWKRSLTGRYSHCLSFWRAFQRWWLEDTFSPVWLPGRWRSLLVGYLAAVALQAILVVLSFLLFQAFPTFAFAGVLHVAAIALVALHWGAGPSLMATLVGVLLLRFAALPPSLAWNHDTLQAVVEMLLFLLAGILISVIASHNQRARLNAEHLSVTLAVEQAHLNAIIEAIPDVVALIAPDGSLVRLNYAGKQALAGNVGRDPPLPAEAILPADVSLRGVLQGATLEAVEGRVRDTLGQTCFVSVSAAPLRDEQGRVGGAVCILRDITRLRKSEDALREANQRMVDFLSLASHELRTPLTTILGNYQMARRRLRRLLSRAESSATDRADAIASQLEAMRQDLQRGEQQAWLMNRLVGDMLDVSRIQHDRFALQLGDSDLVTIVRDAVEAQKHAWPNRRIDLHLLDMTSIPLQVDAERIAQVVTNYLTNALKYSPEDQPVEVFLSVDASMGLTPPQAWVRVRDYGAGVPEAERKQIWERYYRAPRIEVQDGSRVGLGLGLYICRIIVERHQGEVGLDSMLGEGSTFWFTLPLPAPAG